MTYFTRSATRHFLLILILPVFYISLFSQDVQRVYPNRGHLTDQVGGMEPAGDEVIYSTSTGHLKMNVSGGIIRRFGFFDPDDYQYSSRPALWGEPGEKPLAIQTVINGYPYSINSNIVYFFVNYFLWNLKYI